MKSRCRQTSEWRTDVEIDRVIWRVGIGAWQKSTMRSWDMKQEKMVGRQVGL